ncbi:hypothetical protein SVIO_012190 [Streptomyces violaceusniger]|uniref:Uncharacterized protein n=1 Tax=Streptomyces violaceusniger TaxID=68280 RepID=A0A4D4KUN1_STRVO|nr:hypothetical protein SVIO_012190 [Streptomyces violaceusniger]
MPGIDECLLEAMTVNGARGAAVIEWTTGLALGMVGEVRDEDPEATAAETAELARMAAEQRAFAALGLGSGKSGADADETDGEPAVEDVIVTTRTCTTCCASSTRPSTAASSSICGSTAGRGIWRSPGSGCATCAGGWR